MANFGKKKKEKKLVAFVNMDLSKGYQSQWDIFIYDTHILKRKNK